MKKIIGLFLLSHLFIFSCFCEVGHIHTTDGQSMTIVTSKRIEKNEVLSFFHPVLKSIKKIGLPVSYLIKSIQLVDRVEFVEFEDASLTGTYNKLTNVIKLGTSFIDPETGKLKKLSQLTKTQITTIYHELWHVYNSQYIKKKRPLFYYLYINQLSKNYSGVFYGNTYQSEAYGVYIDQVIANYLDFFAIFRSVGKEGREKLRSSLTMKKRFFEMVNRPAYGYRLSVLERGVVFSEVNLSVDDRFLIFEHVFKNEISFYYNSNFPEGIF